MASSTSKTPKKKAAKKAAKKKTRSQLGRMSRQKGDKFERKIANELRQIYDPSDLLAKMEAARAAKDVKELKRLQKASCISRGEQRRGAKHADILCEPCPCWIELQDAAAGNYRPHAKLQQAQRDVAEAGSDKLPVAVCHQTGRCSTEVAMTVRTLCELAGAWEPGTWVEWFHDPRVEDQVVIMDWEAFKMMLEGHFGAQV